jgi:putative aminopeptidase FrvX
MTDTNRAQLKDLLFSLLREIGPSGREGRAAKKWQQHASQFGVVRKDVNGNSYVEPRSTVAYNPAPTAHRIVLTAHIDEIGFVIQSIDDSGVLWIDEVGGWDAQVLAGQRVVILHEGAEVCGVVGRPAIHLIEESELGKASKIKDLWIDIGAVSKEDAERRVSIGDMGVVDVQPLELSDTRWASRAMDNRVGSCVVLEAFRRLVSEGCGMPVSAVVTSMEEVGLRGAKTAVEATKADIVIAVDVTFATDVGEPDKKQLGEHALGSGPVITRAAFHSPVLEALLIKAAKDLGIKYTTQAAGYSTGTDADAFSLGGRGVATGLVSVPLRHMHTPGEVVDFNDIEATVQLLVAFCKLVTADTDLQDR